MAWIALLLLAVGVGLGHLADYGADYDEGVLLQTAVLAHQGHALYDPIVYNKPPLLIWWVQLFFTLGGPTPAAARLGLLLLNTAGLAALGTLAAAWWGRWAGPTAVLLFLLLPDTLPRLPTVTPDLPAMSLMLLALLPAARFSGRWRGAAAAVAAAVAAATAGLFFALGLGVHPVLLFMLAPLALVFINRRDLTGLVIVGLTAVLVTLFWLLLVEGEGFRQWVIVYNRAPLDATLSATAAKNGQKLLAFGRAQWALAALAGISALWLWPANKHQSPTTHHRYPIIVCLLWLAAALFTLSRLQPMWEHYLVFLAYPLWLLAAGGLVTAVKTLSAVAPKRSARSMLLPLLTSALGVGFLVVNLAAPRPWGEWPPGYQAALDYLQHETAPGSLIITDEPFLALAAGLHTPPALADTSTKRMATGFLQPADVINAQLRDGVAYGLWGNGRFQQLPAISNWAGAAASQQTTLGDLTLYHFNTLTPTHTLNARLEPGIHLRGYTLPPSADEHALAVTLFWETEIPLPADYKVLLHVLDSQGHLVAQADGDPLGGWLPTSAWAPGVMVPYTAVIPLPPTSAPPFTLAAGMYTWPEGARLPAFQADDSRWAHDLIIVTDVVK